ncbi:MAG TPA: hypothetical protein VJO13_06210 [Ktedonobacterales bacterium]|nr:hypothetical protein [Ktedonobacterales bacterium]
MSDQRRSGADRFYSAAAFLIRVCTVILIFFMALMLVAAFLPFMHR